MATDDVPVRRNCSPMPVGSAPSCLRLHIPRLAGEEILVSPASTYLSRRKVGDARICARRYECLAKWTSRACWWRAAANYLVRSSTNGWLTKSHYFTHRSSSGGEVRSRLSEARVRQKLRARRVYSTAIGERSARMKCSW